MISTPTGDVVIDQDLCSIMLKPATVSRGGGKRRRLSLDPGNKCITGDIFLTAVRTENERKEKEKEEKERKKQERARLAEEKKKKAEEKKKKIQERKEANKKKREEKQLKDQKAKNKNVTKKKNNNKRFTIDKLLEQTSYTCRSCKVQYVEDDPCEWVECDYLRRMVSCEMYSVLTAPKL